MKVLVIFHGELSVLTGTTRKYYFDVSSLSDLRFRILDDFPGIVHVNHRICINEKTRSGKTRIRDDDKICLIPSENY